MSAVWLLSETCEINMTSCVARAVRVPWRLSGSVPGAAPSLVSSASQWAAGLSSATVLLRLCRVWKRRTRFEMDETCDL